MAEFQPEPEKPDPTPKHMSARVPESVARGRFSTGVVVMGTPTEVVLDFLQTLVHPNELVDRVVLPWQTIPNLISAMSQNLENHEKRFGTSPGFEPESDFHRPLPSSTPESEGSGSPGGEGAGEAMTGPSMEPRQTAASEAKKFYEDLKYDENALVGSYSNGAMINHTEFEFKIDFLCSLQPYPIVTSRNLLVGQRCSCLCRFDGGHSVFAVLDNHRQILHAQVSSVAQMHVDQSKPKGLQRHFDQGRKNSPAGSNHGSWRRSRSANAILRYRSTVR